MNTIAMLQASLLRAGALCVLFSVYPIIYFIRQLLSKPRLLPGAPYVGLDGGRRTLAEARQRFLAHGGELIQEGYDMVTVKNSPQDDRLLRPKYRPMVVSTMCRARHTTV